MRAVIAFFILITISIAMSEIQTGHFRKTKTNWQFLGKFVYQTGVTNIWNFTIDTKNPNMRALLYFWSEGRGIAGSEFYNDHAAFERGEISCANFSARAIRGGNVAVRPNVTQRFRPSSNVRPYWWFLAVADCSQEHLEIDSYRLEMVQVNGSHWEYQFSWDQWGIGVFTLLFLFFYLILLGVHAFGSYQLWRIEGYHSIIKLFSISLLLQFLVMFLHYIHYSSFANNGIGSPGLLGLGNLIDNGATLTLMFLCILIAKGWAITTSYITQKYLLLAVTTVLVFGFLVLFFWTEFLLDPLFSLFVYETPPGIILLAIRFLMVFWFLFCLRDTLRNETNPEKRKFYLPFALLYGIWFVSLPATVFILSFVDGYIRLKIVTISAYFCDALGYAVLAYLFWPSRAREYFSIRTGQLLEKNATTSLIKDQNL